MKFVDRRLIADDVFYSSARSGETFVTVWADQRGKVGLSFYANGFTAGFDVPATDMLDLAEQLHAAAQASAIKAAAKEAA